MSTYPTLEPIKTGDSVALACVYKLNNVPTSVTQYTITSQLRGSNGSLLLNFIVTKDNQTTNPGLFRLSTSPNPPSPALPIDMCRCDIQFVTTADGTVRSSQTFFVPVESQITVP